MPWRRTKRQQFLHQPDAICSGYLPLPRYIPHSCPESWTQLRISGHRSQWWHSCLPEIFDHPESCRESRETDEYAVLDRCANLTQWTIWFCGRERTWTTLVFALAICYAGLRAEVGYPCAQVMAKLDEPGYRQKSDGYQRDQLTVHGGPFRLLLRVSATERISYACAQRHSVFSSI